MPKERKKRGRRQEEKEIKEEEKEEKAALEIISERNPIEQEHEIPQGAFFGLLDEQELAYYGNLDTLITANQFDDDEKSAFIENTFTEIRGRELKIATCMFFQMRYGEHV